MLNDQQLAAYGWRIAFGLCGLLGIAGLWMRSRIDETEQFAAVAREGPGEGRLSS
ncbi:MFS transporter [Streptomyces colonosanans]|uniref:MFS transporter n=1 Tax=Streptomyces colonosanans TaxID=1428652 RepID=UPI00115F8768|nr:MFS transporter [Streptomyces colonosanans]